MRFFGPLRDLTPAAPTCRRGFWRGVSVPDPTPTGVSPMSMLDSVAEQLRQDTAAVRLHRSRFGARKSITKEQRTSAASLFYAKADMLSASKKLLDTKAEAYKNVTGILSKAVEAWKLCTVPYPEPGIRLIKRERVEAFQNQMIGLQAELDQAVAGLQDAY